MSHLNLLPTTSDLNQGTTTSESTRTVLLTTAKHETASPHHPQRGRFLGERVALVAELHCCRLYGSRRPFQLLNSAAGTEEMAKFVPESTKCSNIQKQLPQCREDRSSSA